MAYSEYYSSLALVGSALGVGLAWGKVWAGRMVARRLAVANATAVIDHDLVVDTQEYEALQETEDEVIFKKPKRRRGLFRNHLKHCGKMKFGCPADTPANRLVVRKYLVDICVDKGVKARHINMNVDYAVSMVFVPSKYEVEAAAVAHTSVARDRGRLYRILGGGRPQVA